MRLCRISSVIVLLVVFLFCGFSVSFAGQFSGGDGTAGDPFIVTTAAQLDLVRENLLAHYRLNNDIDLTEYLSPNGAGYVKWGSAGWDPIGRAFEITGSIQNTAFRGRFDGNWHMIAGLWINRSGENSVGLFGGAQDAIIENLGVKIIGDVVGANHVGGLVGIAHTWDVGSNITNCYVTGNVSGNNYVGGLAGSSVPPGSITNCYATGNVSGNNGVGGLVGLLNGNLTNSYATNNISGNDEVGGLVGQISFGWVPAGRISNCFSIGKVVGNSNAGAVVGINRGAIVNSYRYNLATVNNAIRTENTPNGIHGGIVNANQLTTQTTYTTTLTSWVFSNIAWHWDAASFPKLNIGVENYPFPFSVPQSYTINASPTSLSFGSLQTPYTQPAAQTVTITNTSTGVITLTKPTASNFTIGTLSSTNLAPGAMATFTVQPKARLAVGNYNETITISGTNDASTTVNASFVVTSGGGGGGSGGGGSGSGRSGGGGGGCNTGIGILVFALTFPLLMLSKFYVK